jgi:hypothetical protein
VEKDDVPILEYLMKGWERPGMGVFGGRWERPPNVFSAAKDFKKKLERQKERARSGERSSSSSPCSEGLAKLQKGGPIICNSAIGTFFEEQEYMLWVLADIGEPRGFRREPTRVPFDRQPDVKAPYVLICCPKRLCCTFLASVSNALLLPCKDSFLCFHTEHMPFVGGDPSPIEKQFVLPTVPWLC